jgi:hypothetical protein
MMQNVPYLAVIEFTKQYISSFIFTVNGGVAASILFIVDHILFVTSSGSQLNALVTTVNTPWIVPDLN